MKICRCVSPWRFSRPILVNYKRIVCVCVCCDPSSRINSVPIRTLLSGDSGRTRRQRGVVSWRRRRWPRKWKWSVGLVLFGAAAPAQRSERCRRSDQRTINRRHRWRRQVPRPAAAAGAERRARSLLQPSPLLAIHPLHERLSEV